MSTILFKRLLVDVTTGKQFSSSTMSWGRMAE
jgi:hypothetical protein